MKTFVIAPDRRLQARMKGEEKNEDNEKSSWFGSTLQLYNAIVATAIPALLLANRK